MPSRRAAFISLCLSTCFAAGAVAVASASDPVPAGGGAGAAVRAGEVRGRVVVAATGAGLPGASVSIRGGARATATLADGRFFLTGVPSGTQVIECGAAGYESEAVAVEVAPGGVTHARCALRRRGEAPVQAQAGEKVREEKPAEDSVDELLGAAHERRPVMAAPLPPAAAPAGSAASAPVHDFGRIHGMGRVEVGGAGGLGTRGTKASLGGKGYGTGGGGSATGVTIGVGHAGMGRGAGFSAPAEAARASTRYALRAPPAQIAADAAQIAGQDFNREGYDGIVENPFVGVTDEPLSTFSIDVDTASYSNVRRLLRDGGHVPRDAVRIEEMINYFRYDYPNPTGPEPFSVNTEVSSAPWKSDHRLVRIGLQGRRIDAARLPPANLTFLIDVSGSMNAPNKLPLLKQSFRLLVDTLRPQDRVAMVVYAGAAGVVLPPTDGTERGRIVEALENLQAGGSTAGAEGIRLAYQTARSQFVRGGNNRVILATDGDFNVGVSSDGELLQIIEQERKSGVFLTILGFGAGNYQDAKMQKLADAGNGHHVYIDDLDEARKTLVAEMGATLLTIAKDVKLQVEFNPSRVKGYRLIGYENRRLANRDFDDDKKDAGELGAGHSVTALYEIIPAGSSEAIPGVQPLKYQAVAPTAASGSEELLTVKLRYKAPDADDSRLLSHVVVDAHTPLERTSDDFRFATAVAEFGLLLRDSPHKGDARHDAVLRRAAGALGRDEGGLRSGFLALAGGVASQRAQALAR